MRHAPAFLAALAFGCAQAPSPAHPPPDPGAEEQIRRTERLRLMQEYWEQATASEAPRPAPLDASAPLDYPAGNYSGLNFAPRTAADPSLREPPR
jgi:hypothetical protein